jgi:hypothetical protein
MKIQMDLRDVKYLWKMMIRKLFDPGWGRIFAY